MVRRLQELQVCICNNALLFDDLQSKLFGRLLLMMTKKQVLVSYFQ